MTVIQWYYEGGHKPFIKRSSKNNAATNMNTMGGGFGGASFGGGFGATAGVGEQLPTKVQARQPPACMIFRCC